MRVPTTLSKTRSLRRRVDRCVSLRSARVASRPLHHKVFRVSRDESVLKNDVSTFKKSLHTSRAGGDGDAAGLTASDAAD